MHTCKIVHSLLTKYPIIQETLGDADQHILCGWSRFCFYPNKCQKILTICFPKLNYCHNLSLIIQTVLFWVHLEISLVYIWNKIGPKLDPCSTPLSVILITFKFMNFSFNYFVYKHVVRFLCFVNFSLYCCNRDYFVKKVNPGLEVEKSSFRKCEKF